MNRGSRRHAIGLTSGEAEARRSAIEKVDRRTGPAAAQAAAQLAEDNGYPLTTAESRALVGLFPELHSIGHATQAAAAENA